MKQHLAVSERLVCSIHMRAVLDGLCTVVDAPDHSSLKHAAERPKELAD